MKKIQKRITLLSVSLLTGAALLGCSASNSSQTSSNSQDKTAQAIKHSPDSDYLGTLDKTVVREHVSYTNRFGIRLAADLYYPENLDKSEKHEAIVIGPPYGGVKEQDPSIYANEMAKRGYVVVAYDNSYNGFSQGEPRHVSSPELFTEDVSASVDYLGTLDFVDRDQISAIGICASGGYALSAAQVDTRFTAVVTTSMVDITGNDDMLTAEERKKAIEEISEQRWKDVDASDPQVVNRYPDKPVSEIPDNLESDIPSFEEFYSYYATERGFHENALGGFTTTSQGSFMNYSLLEHLGEIQAPVMMVVGTNAMSKAISETAYEKLNPEKENQFVEIEGANHIDLYDRTDLIPFDKIDQFIKEANSKSKK